MKLRVFALAAFVAVSTYGQELQFEVASVRQVDPGDPTQVNVGLHLDGTQATISGLTMKQYIGMAYRLRPNHISGPDWIATERYAVRATLPEGSTTKQIPAMLKTLLGERFGLRMHKDQKEFQVYVLGIGKRPLALKPNTDTTAAPADVNIAASGSAAGVSVNLGGGASYTFANNKLEGHKLDMETMVDVLESYLNLPVVDETRLSGYYDVTLEITPEDYRAMLIRAAVNNGVTLPPQALQFADTATTPSLFEAIEKLGLKLETRRMPMDVFIVDEIRKTPTEN